MSAGCHDLQRQLQRLRNNGMLRTLKLPQGIDFSSNDYLGHSRHPQVLAAAEQALKTFGAGAPASRLLRGHTTPHAELEKVAAAWQGTEAALMFASGFQANLALLQTLPRAGDVIFSDKLNHASIIDGCRLSRARIEVFDHNDVEDLRQKLQAVEADVVRPRKWIVTERVFSMDGDQAPLQQLLTLCDEYDALLLLDEAHSAGLFPVLPPHPRLLSRMITGGKALGIGAALVCGSQELIDTLINRGRSFIYTTATPPATAAALAQSIQLVQQHPERVAAVHRKASHLRAALTKAGLPLLGDGPIVPVVLGDSKHTMKVADQLQRQGFDVRGVRPPTVPFGSSRIRIVVHADHSTQQLHALAQALICACSTGTQAPAAATVPSMSASNSVGASGSVNSSIRATLICGTDTGVGKTVLSALMMLQLQRAGNFATYLKPVQTGSDSDTATVRRLAGLSDEQAPPPLFEFDLPASIDQAAEFEQRSLTANQVVNAVQQKLAGLDGDLEDVTDPAAADSHRHWLLELAGGLLVPLNRQQTQADVIQQLNFPVVLAARSALGTLNHTLLTVEALRNRGLNLIGVLVIGGKHPGNLKSLRGILPGLPIVEIPNFDHLDRRHLQAWVDQGHLDCLVPRMPVAAGS